MKYFGFCALTAVLAILGLRWFLFTIYSDLPAGKTQIHLANAMGSSTIIKEGTYGTSHVYGDSMHMAIYTQGYVHAQERLWAMERMRRFANGSLSEIFSSETIEVDKLSLTVGIKRAAEARWAGDGLS
jgi:penicillin G amidase